MGGKVCIKSEISIVEISWIHSCLLTHRDEVLTVNMHRFIVLLITLAVWTWFVPPGLTSSADISGHFGM